MYNLTALAHTMMGGAKAAECSSSAYYMRLFMNVDSGKLSSVIRELNLKWIDKLKHTEKLKSHSTHQVFSNNEISHELTVLAELINFLQIQLSLAQDNLLHASVESPVYGVLEVIRISLETIELSNVPDDFVAGWRELLGCLIKISTSVAKLVTPVVCNSSPEGCLPDLAINALKQINVADIDVLSWANSGANAQSLVVCCWHCMKEVSLLLGDIVERAPLVSVEPQSYGLITVEQVLNIGDLFTYHLMEAKHMGAFEMAYAGFHKLCGVLWASTSPLLKQKPQEWAQKLLDSFKMQDSEHRVTRRSAGVPYYLLAILSTEPDLTGRSCLKAVMNTLLHIACNDQPDSDSLQPSCVHALNILRALFRESRLGDHVMSYVAGGFKTALFGISSDVWAVRNSSTLLFSALMTRVFGVKRLSDEHCQENKMTSKQFFTKFPSLHSFLLKELNLATSPLEADRFDVLQPSLFPMLLLLSRLYPSTLDDGGDPNMSLQPFVNLVLRCAKSSVWKIREAASRALLMLLSQTELTKSINLLYSSGLGIRGARQNHTHGLFLMLYALLLEMFPTDWKTGLNTICLLLKISWIGKQINRCPVTRGTYLQILGTFFDQFHLFAPSQQFHHSVADKLELFCDSLELLTNTGHSTFLHTRLLVAGCCYCYLVLTCTNPSVCDQEVISAAASLLVCDHSHDNVIVCFVSTCLQHSVYEVKQCVLTEMKRKPLSNSNMLTLVPIFYDIGLSATNPELLTLVYELLIDYHKTDNISNDHILKLMQNILKMNHFPNMRMCLKEASINLASHILSSHVTDNSQMLLQWVELLKDSYGPSQPESLRRVVASALGRSWRILLQHSSHHNDDVVIGFWLLLIELLQDYDVDCRSEAARYMSHTMSDFQGHYESMHSQYCLEVVFTLVKQHHKENLYLYIKVILQYLETADVTNFTWGQNILFVEGPINDYKEEAIPVQLACNSLKSFINNPIGDLAALEDLKTFSRTVLTNTLSFIKHVEESSTMLPRSSHESSTMLPPRSSHESSIMLPHSSHESSMMLPRSSHIAGSVHKMLLVLDVLQLIDKCVTPVLLKLKVLITSL